MDTADVLFIAAEPREFAGAMRFWTDVKVAALPVHWARTARWKGKKIVAIANGAGPVRAALAAKVMAAKVVVNVGYCGALDGALRIGDIVVGDQWLQPHASGRHVKGPIASIDHIAQTASEKQRLRETGAVAVEMEVGGLEGLPCYCIKSVSDLADESFANNLNSVLEADGRVNILKLILGAFLRPGPRFSELIRLQQRSKIASNTLGEFLESCEF
jgi:nucleoside phosphorylase